MAIYYVEKNEVYKIAPTVDCTVQYGNEELFVPAGSIGTFKATTNKVSVSDANAVLTCISETQGDLSGLSEHVNNQGIHVTSSEKSKWNNAVDDLSDVKTDVPALKTNVQNLGNSIDALDESVTEHSGSTSIHVTNAERQNWNAAHTHSNTSNVHITSTERQTWNGKANGTHSHAISDITNLQTTLNGKASTSDITNLQTALNSKASTSDLASLDVGVKRIDYWTEQGEGVQIYSNSKTLTDASSFSDYKEYKATKDVCLIYTVTNSPGSGQTSDFSGFYYNYPLKMWMGVKVNGSYLVCEAASRRVCSGGIDFIQVHLKAGDEVKFNTSSISTYTGYVRIRLLEFNYR
jgi:hypothetical protein